MPDIEAGSSLGSEVNGVSVGEGGEGRPGPPERGKIRSQLPSKAGTTWGRTRKTNQVGHDGGGSVRTE